MTKAEVLTKVKQSVNFLKVIPKDDLTEEVLFELIEMNVSIDKLPAELLTKKMIKNAIDKNIFNIQYIPESLLTEEIKLYAIKKDTYAITYFENHNNMQSDIILKSLPEEAKNNIPHFFNPVQM